MCDWRQLAFYERIDPPSWDIADLVRAEGHRGVLFPSTRGSGTNLVVYPELLTPDDHLAVHDPEGRLPRDRASWSHRKD